MRTFEFASPLFLWLLLALLPLAWRVLRRRDMTTGAGMRYSDLRLFRTLPRSPILALRRWLPLLRLAALALFIIALARPRFGMVEREVIQEGVDLFYCLDISGSMRAEDLTPSRLERAKILTKEFASKRTTDRQGIVLFSGVAFMMCPMTFDNNAVQGFLDSVTFDKVDGTAIGMGLTRALKALQDSHAKSKVIILMTDGDNNAGDITPEQATQAAKKLGVKIYTIGIGTPDGAYVTMDTPMGPMRQRMEADLNEPLLKKIASETGAIYHRATNDKELAKILDEINKLEKSKIEMKEYRTFDERMAIPIGMGLALLLLEILLLNTRFLKIP
jgi:Ca-activated chloride channel homolog